LRETRRLADDDHEHACCKRIERSGVTDATFVQNVTRARDYVVRRHAGRFIDD